MAVAKPAIATCPRPGRKTETPAQRRGLNPLLISNVSLGVPVNFDEKPGNRVGAQLTSIDTYIESTSSPVSYRTWPPAPAPRTVSTRAP